jgi:hypothetical protein
LDLQVHCQLACCPVPANINQASKCFVLCTHIHNKFNSVCQQPASLSSSLGLLLVFMSPYSPQGEVRCFHLRVRLLSWSHRQCPVNITSWTRHCHQQ